MIWIGVALGIIAFILVVNIFLAVYSVRKAISKNVFKDKERKTLDDKQWAESNENAKKIDAAYDTLMKRKCETLSVTSKDGLKLWGYYFACDNPKSDKVVIALHGYTGNGLKECSVFAPMYMQNDYNMLIIDLRCHGKSEGNYIGFGVLDRFDLLLWIKKINEKFSGKCKIVLHGISMGSATVLMTSDLVCTDDNVKSIVADCGFTSPFEEFKHVTNSFFVPVLHFASLWCKIVAKYGFKDADSRRSVANTNVPILFIHGDKDDFVPTRMSYENYKDCKSEKKLVIVKGAGHTESFFKEPETYKKEVMDFLDKYV